MKKPIALFLVLCLLAAGAGCSAPQDQGTAVPTPAVTNDVIIVSPTAPFEVEPTTPSACSLYLPPVHQSVNAEDGVLIYSCTHQDMTLHMEDTQLQEAIQADLTAWNQAFLDDAVKTREQAEQDYAAQDGWIPYSTARQLEQLRIDSRVLSLWCSQKSYNGSPHPTLSATAITYDLTTGTRLTLSDVLAENWSRDDLILDLCAQLAPRADDLYPDYEHRITEMFSGENSWTPEWCLTVEGLCFLFTPYSISPPDSGIIAVQIPLEELDGLIRETYLPLPTAANGSIYSQLFRQEDADRFTDLTELPLSPQGPRFLLYPDATVSELRIETIDQTADGFQPQHLVFAADTLCHGSALLLQADLQETPLRLTYRSEAQQISVLIHYDPKTDQLTLQ